MKGIILAGGSGTRLYPLTECVSKQLLPVYDKPMIYYPLSVLMLAKIREILIITTKEDQDGFIRILGNGNQFGVNIEYAVQDKPEGLAQAFIIGEQFIGNDDVCLILGDNIFWGQGFSYLLDKAVNNKNGATVFGYKVSDPERFGIAEYDENKEVISLEEKPNKPKSNTAVTGLYFYDNEVVKLAKEVKPSARGELEITTLNEMYMKKKSLKIEILGRGYAWLDTGTFESLIEAGLFVQTIEKRQGYKIACLEEIALSNKWIGQKSLEISIKKYSKNTYGNYLRDLRRRINEFN